MYDLTVSHGCPRPFSWRGGRRFQILMSKVPTSLQIYPKLRQLDFSQAGKANQQTHREAPKDESWRKGRPWKVDVEWLAGSSWGQQQCQGDPGVRAGRHMGTEGQWQFPFSQPSSTAQLRGTCLPYLGFDFFFFFFLKQEEVGERGEGWLRSRDKDWHTQMAHNRGQSKLSWSQYFQILSSID